MENSPANVPTSPASSVPTEPFSSPENTDTNVNEKESARREPLSAHPPWTAHPDAGGLSTAFKGKAPFPPKRIRFVEADTGSSRSAHISSRKRPRFMPRLPVPREHLGWSVDEDWELVTMRRRQLEWDTICTAFPGRTADDCALRYRCLQDSPEFNKDVINEVAFWYRR